MEGIHFQAKMIGSYQITIPIETREFIDIAPGDVLSFVIIDVKKIENRKEV